MNDIAKHMARVLRKRVTKNAIIGLLHRVEDVYPRAKKPRRSRAQIEIDAANHARLKAATCGGKSQGSKGPSGQTPAGHQSCGSSGTQAGKPAKGKPSETTPRSLLPVHGKTCQYLEGEPRDRNFCGKQAVRDMLHPTTSDAWCAYHIDLMYTVQKDGPGKMKRLEDFLSSSRKRLATLLTEMA